MAIRKATGRSPIGLVSDEFIRRLQEEFGISPYYRELQGCGWNQRGVQPAPHCYYVRVNYEYGIDRSHAQRVQDIFDECCELHACVRKSPLDFRAGYPAGIESTLRCLSAKVWTKEYEANRSHFNQLAIARYLEKHHEEILAREAEKARELALQTPQGVQDAIARWQTEHNLLPFYTTAEGETFVIAWKLVKYDPCENPNRYVGLSGYPHKVGETFTYNEIGNACAGPYGAAKQLPLAVGSTHAKSVRYLIAVAVPSTHPDVQVDLHSHGVLTFQRGATLAAYRCECKWKLSEIDSSDQGIYGYELQLDTLDMHLIEGEDVLPLIMEGGENNES